MILWNDAGLAISADEAGTEYADVIMKMHTELCRWQREALWWRDAATGKMLTDAVKELNDEEPF